MLVKTAPPVDRQAPQTADGIVGGGRVASVDVYRGLVMLLMMAEVLAFRKVAEARPESAFWRVMHFN